MRHVQLIRFGLMYPHDMHGMDKTLVRAYTTEFPVTINSGFTPGNTVFIRYTLARQRYSPMERWQPKQDNIMERVTKMDMKKYFHRIGLVQLCV